MNSHLKLTLTNEQGEVLWQWVLAQAEAQSIWRHGDRSFAASVARVIEHALPVEEHPDFPRQWLDE